MIDRRYFLVAPAAALAALAMPNMAQAQNYPSKPVRFVIGFPAGGPNDILGRIIAQWLSEETRSAFNVENKGGKSGNIATEEVVRAPADGYTILLVGPANAISGSLYPNLSFDILRDIVPVAGITREPLVMVVHPSVPAKTVPEFLASAKANPGAIKMATTGAGSSPHVSGELFRHDGRARLDVVHYGGGGPALKAMIAGEAQMMFEPMSASIGPVRSRKLRALAVTTGSARDAAGCSDHGRNGARLRGERGDRIGVPNGTPAEIIAALTRQSTPPLPIRMRARLADTGGDPLPGRRRNSQDLRRPKSRSGARSSRPPA